MSPEGNGTMKKFVEKNSARLESSTVPLSEIENLCKEEGLESVFNDFKITCLRYIQDIINLENAIRNPDLEIDSPEVLDADKRRTQLHDMVYDSLNEMVLILGMAGRSEVRWIKDLHEGEVLNRNKAGIFAIKIGIEVSKQAETIYNQGQVSVEVSGGHL